MCCWDGKEIGAKKILIPLIEVLDIVLEIIIVVLFSQIQEEYNDNRARGIDVAKAAGLI